MKNQNNQRRQMILLAAIATIFLLCASGSTFAQNIGIPFGAREPRTCADRTSPKTGALTAAQATKYLICDSEIIFGTKLYFVENVTVQLGKARPYNPNEDVNFPNIDLKFPVYPIRGSYKSYGCAPVNGDGLNRGKNCIIYDEPNAKGACYKDSFGDWHCGMTDASTGKFIDNEAAPPGSAKETTTSADKKNAQNNKVTETKTETDNQAEGDYPKPDFSAMEKWFEIVRYEYSPLERKLYIYLKPKVETRPTEFKMEFRDKDGIEQQDTSVSWILNIPSYLDAAVGEMKKVYVGTPSEKDLGKTVIVKVVRFVQ